VVTRKDGLPFTEENYLSNERCFNEIVLGDEAQVVPIFLVKVGKSNFSKLASDYQREIVKLLVTVDDNELTPLMESDQRELKI